MAYPVIVDCGGSTRIKWLEQGDKGAMDALLEVDPAEARSTHFLQQQFSKVRVVSISAEGNTKVVLNSRVVADDHFTISSENDQQVLLNLDATGVKIIVQGKRKNPPIVEAKQLNGKRRYVVVNAGAIKTITGKADGRIFGGMPFNVRGDIYVYVALVLL